MCFWYDVQMNKQIIGVVIVAVLVVGGFFWYTSRVSAPTSTTQQGESTTTQTVATSTPPTTTTSPTPTTQKPFTFLLIAGDTVASWNFQGAYTGNAELTQKAQVEIARLSAMLGSGTFTNYELYVSIANQYDLLGDGTQEFVYLKKALTLDSTRTGLAWSNMGNLFTRLGAYRTARVAFENAVIAQPIAQYIQDLINFLQAHFPQDSAAIQKAQKLLQ